MTLTKTILDEMLEANQSMVVVGPTWCGKTRLLVDFVVNLRDRQRNALVYHISERDPQSDTIAQEVYRQVNRRIYKYGTGHPAPLWVVCDNYPLNQNIQRTIVHSGRQLNIYMLRAIQGRGVCVKDTGLTSQYMKALKLIYGDGQPNGNYTNFKWAK